jgi:hypothetical protein
VKTRSHERGNPLAGQRKRQNGSGRQHLFPFCLPRPFFVQVKTPSHRTVRFLVELLSLLLRFLKSHRRYSQAIAQHARSSCPQTRIVGFFPGNLWHPLKFTDDAIPRSCFPSHFLLG